MPEHLKDGGQIRLRPATMADAGLVLAWQNEPDTRRYFNNSEPVQPDDHARWFRARLESPGEIYRMICRDGCPIGILRLEPDSGGAYVVSIVVAPAHRGGGVGTAALLMARRLVPQAALRAQIHADNEASRRAFMAAGFEDQGDVWTSCPFQAQSNS